MSISSDKSKSHSFEEFLILLVKYRRILLINVSIVTIAAIIISLLMPNEYTSTTSFISPKKKGGLFGDIAGFSNTIKDLSRTLGGRIGATSDEAYNYLVILQSRTASEKMIKKFNLREIYEIDKSKPFENVLSELEDRTTFQIADEGNIMVSVTDKDPKRAAEMANYYVEILNELSTDLSVAESRNNRVFIEKRFVQAQDDIRKLEDSLEIFSKKYNVLALEEQMKAAITVAAELKAQIEIAKLEKELLEKKLGSDNPLVEQAVRKVEELDKQLMTLKFGENKNLKSSLNLFIPFEKIPETGVAYVRLMRDYEIQNKLLEFLYPIYEQARIEEQKDIPVVLVVDKAIAPQKKSAPKRTLIVAGAFLLSFLTVLFYFYVKESYFNLSKDEIRFKRIKEGIIDPLKINRKISKKQ